MRATRRRRKKSFDELISGYYGSARGGERTIEDVLATYYGQPRVPRRDPKSVVMSLSRDDGEVLQQAPAPNGAPPATAPAPPPSAEAPASGEEYVVWSSDAAPPAAPTAPAAPPALPVAAPAAPAEAPPIAAASLAADVTPAEEYALDVLSPLEGAPPAPAVESASGMSGAQTLEKDELAADMEAILSGQKVYDPASGRTVDRDSMATQPSAPASAPPPAPSGPEFSNEHAIFDAIRESMTYANAYDLGTVELENRFADFDRRADIEQQPKAAAPVPVPAPAAPVAPAGQPKVGSEDFLQDLDEIRARVEGTAEDAIRRAAEAMPSATASSVAEAVDIPGRHATCATSALQLALAERDPAQARAMWDSGEHALAGGDLYPNQLQVGRAPGVAFSYGQLLAMGDLFESPEELMGADPAELTRLKALIDRNTEYYRTGKTTPSLDVSHSEWEKATNGRYLTLAEKNYEHFSPNTLFDDAVARAATKQGNNRSAWESYHRQAIEEAQRLALVPENQNRSYVPESALVINAFGDHFLTDAFASGHLINKELMIAYFRKNFFSGSSLTDAAEDFFERVAKAAFVGDVAKKFSKLETVDYPFCAFGWCLKKRPNISSVWMFKNLLLEAAAAEPVKVANFAVKALHDELNEKGVDVTNAAGDGQWKLTGDGYLNAKSLAVMKKAVQQSVDNINDPAIQQSNLSFGPFFDRVWRFVPQPTASERTRLKNLVQEYTNPRSRVLSDAAAAVIRNQVDSMIDVLIKEGHLQPD
jgi:hypothetical protein